MALSLGSEIGMLILTPFIHIALTSSISQKLREAQCNSTSLNTKTSVISYAILFICRWICVCVL